MEVYKNKYIQIAYYSENKLIIANWTNETEIANKQDFKDWNIELVKQIEANESNVLLANTFNYKFIITPDLQEWSTTNVFAKMAKAGIEKIAMLATNEMFSQVSLEQFVEEYKIGNIVTKYFDDINNAKKWLFE